MAPFTVALCAVAIGNLLALAALNGLSLATGAILWVWPCCVLAGWLLLRGVKWRAAGVRMPRAAVLLAAAWVLLLAAPRLPYLLQRVPETNILATGDDHARMAELVSLTQSPRYPVLHPSSGEFLLSHYYAAFLPMAWLQFALPLLNLKECIFLGNLGYHLLLAGLLLEFSSRKFRDTRPALVFVFLMTFFGGLDWLTTLPKLYDHHEHWFRHLFGEWREISAMYTVAWWAVHHAVGLYCLLACWMMLRQARWRARWRKPFIIGLLLLSVLYSSVFVLLALPFVAPRPLWRIGLRLLRSGLFIPLLALATVPAFLFFGRIMGSAFTFSWPAVWPILVYLGGALVLEFALLPLLVWRDRRMLGSGLFFLSTLFVESIGLNNYTMRGILLPTTILFFCAAPRLAGLPWRKPAAALAIAAVTMGVIREAAWLAYRPLESSPLYWELTGREMPAFARKRAFELKGLDRFNREDLIGSTSIEEMDFNERELLRRPREGWFR